VATLSLKKCYICVETLKKPRDGIFVICKNILNGFWDFSHGTNVGCKVNQGQLPHVVGGEKKKKKCCSV
jgi:hypothetical protein